MTRLDALTHAAALLIAIVMMLWAGLAHAECAGTIDYCVVAPGHISANVMGSVTISETTHELTNLEPYAVTYLMVGGCGYLCSF